MADYKELLRRAISALPENNGAARRAVYEKARAALVGQLRAIDPPLPARDITQHRLQLEDCIRQVEQEASEAVITLGRDSGLAPRPAPPPAAPVAAAPVVAAPNVPARPTVAPPPAKPASTIIKPTESVAKPSDEAPKPTNTPKSAAPASIEDIISQAEQAIAEPVSEPAKPAPEPVKPAPEPVKPVLVESKPEVKSEAAPEPAKPVRPIPSIVARAEAAKSGPTSPLPSDGGQRGPSLEPRREPSPLVTHGNVEPVRPASRIEPLIGGAAAARQQVIEPIGTIEDVPVEAALSAVREVEVEPAAGAASLPDTREAEGAIERAIETLDREARGETSPVAPPNEVKTIERPLFAAPRHQAAAEADEAEAGDTSFAAAPLERRGGAGLTIFLVVFALLLAGAGGAGFWAWREGYVDLDQMFGRADPVGDTAAVTPPPQSSTPTLDTTNTPPAPGAEGTGPGNTETSPAAPEPTSALQGLELDDRLAPTPEPVVPNGTETVVPEPGGEEAKGEERLPAGDNGVAAVDDPAASVDPAILAGSQSLLLEASDDGRTGAVPFSGTIEWSEGVDEIGLPTLVGRANIPARNLGVNLTIRKNSDPSLPASHLMEVDFEVSDSFIGGTIAGLPGVLLKNEELVQGTPLVGASARVVGSSFLFALSASATDAPANADLLTNRKWMDLAVIYGTGKRAIITLEKDDTAQALFREVFAAWNQPAAGQ
jgi:hypothetical protein